MKIKSNEPKKDVAQLFENTVVKKVEVNDELKKSFYSYAMAVNVSRAIPDVRDGLKPVHRRILFAMGELNNFYDKPYKKCARIVGEVMGKYHPHGDSSVYDALVRLAQDFSIREPLVDGHGNFGSVDGDSPAAQRYTEARLSKIAEEMLRDIDKETVDFYPNFDETLMQPRVLPAKFPNLLVNGADGIAVGMATNIPPHNLTEVISGVQALIANPDIDIDELTKIIPAPDYPTGGIIMGRTSVKHAYRTGRGGIVVRGRAEIVEEKNRDVIVVTELPYQVNKAKWIMDMADKVKNKKLEGISDIREESDRDGMRVVIEVKKDANAQVVLNSLYKNTALQMSGGIILLALVDGAPKICNLKEILECYLKHQQDVLIRKTRFDLAAAQKREHIVRGYVIALATIDEVIAEIKASADRQDAIVRLTSKFELDEEQAGEILNMKLSRLTGLEVEKLKQELAELEQLIKDLQFILDTPSKVLEIINNDLEEVKQKYGSDRKTEISLELGGIDIEDLIKEEQVIVSLTHGGYIKRQSVADYRVQRRGGVGISAHKTKEEDFVESIVSTSTHDYLLMFSNLGKVYRIKAYEIPESSRQSKGRAMINLLQLEKGEKISAVVPLAKDNAAGYLIMATKNAVIKKTPVAEFENIRKSGKKAIKLLEGDELIGVDFISEDDEVLIASSGGKCVRFNQAAVRAQGRIGVGVRSMRIEKGESIVAMTVIRPGTQIVTISENGFAKRTAVDNFRLTRRGTKGVKAGLFTEKTGMLIALVQVDENDDLMLIANNGVVIRTRVAQIRQQARTGLGVKVMRLKEGARLISATLARNEGEDETAEAQENIEENPQETQTEE
ncbi:MAG: DNA gyrase subunit A [Clostridia bacterium]